MNTDQYIEAQRKVSLLAALYVLQFSNLLAKPKMTVAEWISGLQFMYPKIEEYRQEAANLAREFYDAERSRALPMLARNDQFLETYSPERFINDMEPARKLMQQYNSTDQARGQLAATAVRAVENAGRQQIIHSVENDMILSDFIDGKPVPGVLTPATDIRDLVVQHIEQPAPMIQAPPQAEQPGGKRIVRGWARVATGRETCAWCLMLVSRGPVYQGPDSAGLDITNSEALDVWDQSGGDLAAFFSSLDDHMEQWHPNCDCKVVPVFKEEGWTGSAQSIKALSLWNDATKTAIQEEEDDPDLTHTAGKNAGSKFTRNERALNALRRQLNEVGVSQFSVIGGDTLQDSLEGSATNVLEGH